MVSFEQLLEQIKETPMSIEALRKKLPPRCKAVMYQGLRGHRSSLFKNHDAIVVLIPKKNSKVGHFIVLLAKRNHIEYFSSLGGTPDSEMKKLGEPSERIKAVLGKNYIYNNVQLQGGAYNINTCAAWVLARVKLASLKLRQFQQIFRRITLHNPDDVVSLMVLLDFVNKD